MHAAQVFFLNQFLSPLFNNRAGSCGGALQNRMRMFLDVISAVRDEVGPDFPVGIKLTATDQLEGGFAQDEAFDVVAASDTTGLDPNDISGGTYFPGSASSSVRSGSGPSFPDFAAHARTRTGVPLMVTGGFKTRAQAQRAITDGCADLVGLARALIVDPELQSFWVSEQRRCHSSAPVDPPEGRVTARDTMQVTQIAKEEAPLSPENLEDAIAAQDARDEARRQFWTSRFG